GESTFKGYGQNPLMNGRNSAPDFKWSSNVNAAGRSEYTGFGREPLTTSNGRSTFVGNNRRLTGTDGRSTFRGNFRSLATPSTRRQFMQNYQAFPNQDSSVKMGGHNVGGSYEDSGSVHSDTTSDAGGATNGQTDAVQPEPGVSEADSENISSDELFNIPYDSVEADSTLQKAPEKKRRFQPENEGEGP
ncbi:MAG: hypothetical protein K2Z81_22195, partial [Cyanobacteria bacterium]|nr:hypothetical protein [Cyanobacteriota bacterium]